jgi:hypothetical protein
MKKVYRIFFSHGSEDNYMARLLKKQLETSGAYIFLDAVEIKYGDDFQKKVIDELSKVEELLVLLTPSSINRPWVHAEIGAALARKKRIVPVSYGVDRSKLDEIGLLSLLGTTRLLSLNDFEAYISELKSRVQG